MRMQSLLLTSILIQTAVSAEFLNLEDDGSWQCGIGPVTNALAYIAAIPVSKTNHRELNTCCKEHDYLIDEFHVAREEADRIFCDCLDSKDSWYVRYILKPAFCNLVKMYTWFADPWEQAANAREAGEQQPSTTSWTQYLRPDRSRSGY